MTNGTVYIVERIIDGPSEVAEEVVREAFPFVDVVHGTKAVGEGRWGSATAWKREWPEYVKEVSMIVASRRTLALGGVLEIEDGMALELPLFILHGRKLYDISYLWYAEYDCITQGCIGYGHRMRMHKQPNEVAQARYGQSELAGDPNRMPLHPYRPN